MGPLSGVKIIEIAGIGPGPFCAMMLADMGADILRIERSDRRPAANPAADVLSRGRVSLVLDLKSPDGIERLLALVEKADALMEGFRPGVCERLGIGPEACHARNQRLVYGRMTGWGQDGPLAAAAGHDINYIALSGALHAIGPKGGKPVPPLNLVGDFGGGGMLLAFGMLAALLEAHRSGRGQVVDAAMVDGSAALMAMFYGMQATGRLHDERGANMLDGGAHFYDTYETRDGRYIAVGSIEPQFYAELVDRAGLDRDRFSAQMDQSRWPELKAELAAIFKSRTRDEWCEIMEGTDVCFAPVLSLAEAPNHPHNAARGTFIEIDGVVQPAPAPRFGRTKPAMPRPIAHEPADVAALLRRWGCDEKTAGITERETAEA